VSGNRRSHVEGLVLEHLVASWRRQSVLLDEPPLQKLGQDERGQVCVDLQLLADSRGERDARATHAEHCLLQYVDLSRPHFRCDDPIHQRRPQEELALAVPDSRRKAGTEVQNRRIKLK
jgi:hypothetical protein